MDGASWASAYGCQGKAVTSAATGRASGGIPADSPIMQKIAEHEGGHMIYSQGAVAIVRSGVVEGSGGGGHCPWRSRGGRYRSGRRHRPAG
jgi:uncharacterized protein GlcG (DUF336 family)